MLFFLLLADTVLTRQQQAQKASVKAPEDMPQESIELSEEVRARLFAPPKEQTPPELIWRDVKPAEIEEATALFQRYMAAGEDWQKLLPIIRWPETTADAMQRLYQRRPPVKLARAEPLGALYVEWRGKKILRCNMAMVSEQARAAFLVREEDSEEYRLDWKSFEHYLPAPWQVFLNDRPAGEQTVRVIITPCDDYSEPFLDRRKFDAFHLGRINETGILFAYVARGSKAHDQLVAAFAGDSPETINTMVLKICYPENALSPRQVEITGMVSPFWLVP